MKTVALSNAILADAARGVADAVLALDAARITAQSIRIEGRRPVIRISAPTANDFIRGALRRRETVAGVTRTVYVASFHGALVEWEVSELRELRQVRA